MRSIITYTFVPTSQAHMNTIGCVGLIVPRAWPLTLQMCTSAAPYLQVMPEESLQVYQKTTQQYEYGIIAYRCPRSTQTAESLQWVPSLDQGTKAPGQSHSQTLLSSAVEIIGQKQATCGWYPL